MRRRRGNLLVLLWALFPIGSVLLGVASEPQRTTVMAFEGYIQTIKIDVCGLQPGECQGSMVLATEAGGEVLLAIEPGMRILRGAHLITVDELEVGDFVKALASDVALDIVPRVMILEVTAVKPR